MRKRVVGSVGTSMQTERAVKVDTSNNKMSLNDKATFSKTLEILASQNLQGDNIFSFLSRMQKALLVQNRYRLGNYNTTYSSDIINIIKQADEINRIRVAISNKQRIIDEMPKYCKVLQNNIRRLQELIKTGETSLQVVELNTDEEHSQAMEDKRQTIEENRIKQIKEAKQQRINERYLDLLRQLATYGISTDNIELSGNANEDVEKLTEIYNWVTSIQYGKLSKQNWHKNSVLLNNCKYVLDNFCIGYKDIEDTDLEIIYAGIEPPIEYIEYSRKIYRILQVCIEDSRYLQDTLVSPKTIKRYIHAESHLGEALDRILKITDIVELLNETFKIKITSIKQMYTEIDNRFGFDIQSLRHLFSCDSVDKIERIGREYKHIRLKATESEIQLLPKLSLAYVSYPDLAIRNTIWILCKQRTDINFKDAMDTVRNRLHPKQEEKPRRKVFDIMEGVKTSDSIKETSANMEKYNKDIEFLNEALNFLRKCAPNIEAYKATYTELHRIINMDRDNYLGYEEKCNKAKLIYEIDWYCKALKELQCLKADICDTPLPEHNAILFKYYSIKETLKALETIANIGHGIDIETLGEILYNKYPEFSVNDIISFYSVNHKSNKVNLVRQYIGADKHRYTLTRTLDLGGVEAVDKGYEIYKELLDANKLDGGKLKDEEDYVIKRVEVLNIIISSGNLQEATKAKRELAKLEKICDEISRRKNRVTAQEKADMEQKALDILNRVNVDMSRHKIKAVEKWADKSTELYVLNTLQKIRMDMMASYTDASYDDALAIASGDSAYTKLFS